MSVDSNKEHFTNKAFVSIWNSSTRMMSLLIFIVTTVALFLHLVDSTSFAAIVSTLLAAFHYHDSKIRSVAMQVQQNLMNPPPSPGA